MRLTEFWPDYGQGPLWSPDGTPVDPASLGLPDDLVALSGEQFNQVEAD